MIEDWHNFGADYDRTLQAWRANIERAGTAAGALRRALPAHVALLPGRLDGDLPRAALQLWQLVLSPRGRAGRLRRAALGRRTA